MSSINFDGNKINLNQNQTQKTDADKTVFTKQQFTNSIMSALSNAGANAQQVQQFSQQAGSIFDAHDANSDSKWSQQEADKGASALQSFYQTVNNAIKGLGTTQEVGQTQGVGQVNQTAEVGATSATDGVKPPTMQDASVEAMKQDIEVLESCGYQITNGSDGAFNIQGRNGETGTIKINGDGTLELSGCAEKALSTAVTMKNMDGIEQKYSGQHGEAVDVKPETRDVNGQQQKVGIMTFQDGTEVMFDFKTGKEIET